MGLTQEQIEKRRTGVSASDLRVIVAYYRGKDGETVDYPLYENESATALWAEKHGKARAIKQPNIMKSGLLAEPIVAKWYAERENIIAHLNDGETFAAEDNPRHLATPDFAAYVPRVPDLAPDVKKGIGPIESADYGVEIKSTESPAQIARWGEGDDTIPVEHYFQMQWNMRVSGLDKWCLVVELLHGQHRAGEMRLLVEAYHRGDVLTDLVDSFSSIEFRTYMIERQNKHIERLKEYANRWLVDIETGNLPEPDGSRAASRALSDLAPADPGPALQTASAEENEMLDVALAAKDERDYAKKLYRQAKQKLQAYCNEHSIEGIMNEEGGFYYDKAGSFRPK